MTKKGNCLLWSRGRVDRYLLHGQTVPHRERQSPLFVPCLLQVHLFVLSERCDTVLKVPNKELILTV